MTDAFPISGTPGVYRRETAAPPAPRLDTGVPGFVGNGWAAEGDATLFELHAVGDLAQLRFGDPATSLLASAIRGFFANGGRRCLVSLTRSDTFGSKDDIHVVGSSPAELQEAALERLAARDDIDLIALPEATLLSRAAALRLQASALAQCASLGDRIAILDALPDADAEQVRAQAAEIAVGVGDIINGALYWPWVATAPGVFVPPCGPVCGVIASTDAAIGVFKAPANTVLEGVIDLRHAIDDAGQATLNDAGINAIRVLPGRGIRIWGARTLSRDPDWRYLPVRRLFLTLSRWVELNLGWVVFEPHTPGLRARIERELRGHLDHLWQAGALVGARAAEAYFVRCDAGNNRAATADNGRLHVDIGLAPAAPAEFITVRIHLRAPVAEAA